MCEIVRNADHSVSRHDLVISMLQVAICDTDEIVRCRTSAGALQSGRPKYKDYFTDDASLTDSADDDDDDDNDEDDDDDEFISEISMREGHCVACSRATAACSPPMPPTSGAQVCPGGQEVPL